MTACAFCHQRKGKRSCPALGSMICAACCGQHRLQEIDCPSSCVYLGGLAVVRDPTSTFTKADYEAAIGKLQTYVASAHAFRNEALARCFDDDKPAEWQVALVMGYLLYGHRDARGLRLVDLFLTARGRALPPGEAAAIAALQRSWAALFEVVAVHTGAGMDLEDTLTGERVHVREISGTAQLKKRDHLFSWLMPVEDHLELTGASSLIPSGHVDKVRDALRREIKKQHKARPTLAEKDLAGSISWTVLRTLRDAIRDHHFDLQTTTGEPLMFCKAHFTITDEVAVRAALAKVAALEPDPTGFAWLDRPDPDRVGTLTLGHIRIEGNELLLETMARDRLLRGRGMIEAALGGLAIHRIDSLQDPEAAIRDLRAQRATAPKADIPDEIQHEVVGKYLRDYYMKWLDLPIPALGDKSPRKAMRSKKGRAQVEELLAGLEHSLSRQPGGDAVDVDVLRAELGIAIAPITLVYDAAVAPDPDAWLAADDDHKAAAIEAHHGRIAHHPETPKPEVHATLHAVVENQLAAGEPRITTATLQRLVGAGVSRHGAIHAIASVVIEELSKVEKAGIYDRDRVARKLAQLRPDDWIDT